MDYFSDLAEDVVAAALYGVVGIALMAVGYVVIDLLTPGHLGRRLAVDRNRNAGVVVASALLAIGLIVTSAILASEGDLLEGLGQSAAYGLIGIALLALAIAVIDVLTPGRLGDALMGEEGHEPMVYVTAAALVAVGGIVAAAIS
ncbi:MAG TPA: DUF350 domain-containing protein [Solirubrobacteraceae bacterium]|jgi:uncharacterized membrane protein YjfL (UPF0719 family)